MVRRSLRSNLWLFVVALGALAQPLHAQSPVAVPLKTYTGYFNGTAVYFTAFETNSSNFAAVNGLRLAPRLSNANVAGLANMIFFQNGSAGQTVVLQTEPGFGDYSPLWHVITATWLVPHSMVVTSYQAALQLWRMGQLSLQSTGIIFNGPVVWVNMNLNRQGGQLAPTISPNEFAGINPAARTIFLLAHPGYFGGQLVYFLALEHAPGVISFAPGAIPVPLIDLNHLGHAAVANFFTPPGQFPVLDAFPNGQVVTNPGNPTPNPGTNIYSVAGIAGKPTQTPPVQGTGQTPQTPQQPVGGTGGGQTPQPTGGVTYSPNAVAGDFGQPGSDMNSLPFFSLGPYANQYSPIWHVHRVMFRPGVAARLIASVQDLAAALSTGLAVQIDGGAQDTFNCPIVSVSQAYVPPSNPNPAPGGNPGYIPPTSTTPGYTPPPSTNPGYMPPSSNPGFTPPAY